MLRPAGAVSPAYFSLRTRRSLWRYTFQEKPYENPAIEYISHSNLLTGGKTSVLSEQEAVRLAKYLAAIKTHFYFNVFNTGQFAYFAMDVEFKIDLPTRELYIKQARPYK